MVGVYKSGSFAIVLQRCGEVTLGILCKTLVHLHKTRYVGVAWIHRLIPRMSGLSSQERLDNLVLFPGKE